MQKPIFKKEQQQQAAEYKKCKDSFKYFVSQHCYIEDRKSKRAILFKLWPGQEAIAPKFLTVKHLILLKARQLGLTWLTAAYVIWRAIFHFHEFIVIISAKEDLAVEFLDRVKFMFDRLPHWMKPHVGKRTTTELFFGREEKDEHGHVEITGLNSTIKSIPSTPDAGQSKTISLLVLDESALNRYCREIWSAAEPTLEHADGQAIVISNPSKDKPGWGWTRDMYSGAIKGENDFEQIFLSWDCVPGRGEDFLDRKRLAGQDDDGISMQYPSTEMEALSSLIGNYFGKTLMRHTQTASGTCGEVLRLKGVLQWVPSTRGTVEIWEHPHYKQDGCDGTSWTKRYAIGSDISEGLSQSYSVAYVLDRLTDTIVCRMRSNKIDASDWAERLYLLSLYYNNNELPALICPERTGAGQTTVKELLKLGAQVYRTIIPATAGKQVTQKFGWSESRQSKQDLAEDLKRWFKETQSIIPCALLLDEASTFILQESGGVGHEGGKMDDCVMGMGCTLQASFFLGGSPKQVGMAKIARLEQQRKKDALPESHKAVWASLDKIVALQQLEEAGSW